MKLPELESCYYGQFSDEFEGMHFDITSEILFEGDIGKGENEYIELYKTSDYEEAKKAINSVVRPYSRRKK